MIYPGQPIPPLLGEPWPEGVVYRALTVGWATTDVVDDQTPEGDEWATHVLSARCTGHNCGFEAGGSDWQTFKFHAADGPPREYVAMRFQLQTEAQRHAENCRAMRRPVVEEENASAAR
ncbi:hypothetical protein ACQEVF_59465 [Nonomuraea polychroma]|uniref:hypothetical protein n=1 Tax=Nonomuraea polychroma TaxID=46176 RepID=UPI003D8B9B96